MDIVNRPTELIRDFGGRLADEYIREYVSLAEHNECAVSLENLCTQLYESDVVPTLGELIVIQELSDELHLGKETWDFLGRANL
ncbi:MafI family immunity protein [Rhizobium leguminosarum]|uniref:MafI family immunity protein n=1 Tax=Rhizobium leguminosarum TaxID=384 RepID=UPI001C954ECC|nr:MafI family immunity protein [Rhizobium leguminosarum]MBY5406615.1 MafI family immunity protein [Rhizobium leguminosarum]